MEIKAVLPKDVQQQLFLSHYEAYVSEVKTEVLNLTKEEEEKLPFGRNIIAERYQSRLNDMFTKHKVSCSTKQLAAIEKLAIQSTQSLKMEMLDLKKKKGKALTKEEQKELKKKHFTEFRKNAIQEVLSENQRDTFYAQAKKK